MRNFDMIGSIIDEILDLYFQQHSLLVTCEDQAVIGATLANAGVNPISGERAIDTRYVRDALSVMYTWGRYDFSGKWAYEVGLPAKSGVGGGIVAVVPGKLAIGAFSPPLDRRGNSSPLPHSRRHNAISYCLLYLTRSMAWTRRISWQHSCCTSG